VSEQPAPVRDDRVFVTAEEKLAIAGNLEAAHRALDRAWGLWTERASTRAWDGQYWGYGDVADLERLTAHALDAIEGSWQALTTALGAHALLATDEP
jgi:hypothetical protein